MSTKKKPAWVAGSPPGRGRYWVVWPVEGHQLIELIEIGPAWIHRNDPTARLLIKMLGGLAAEFDANRDQITHYLPIVPPGLP